MRDHGRRATTRSGSTTREHTANARLSDLLLLEGTRVARSRLDPPRPVRGWAALISGGLDAGRTVAVPAKRPLLIGRSPQADLTVDSASASWSHATVEHAAEIVGGEQEEPAEGRKKPKPETSRRPSPRRAPGCGSTTRAPPTAPSSTG